MYIFQQSGILSPTFYMLHELLPLFKFLSLKYILVYHCPSSFSEGWGGIKEYIQYIYPSIICNSNTFLVSTFGPPFILNSFCSWHFFSMLHVKTYKYTCVLLFELYKHFMIKIYTSRVFLIRILFVFSLLIDDILGLEEKV